MPPECIAAAFCLKTSAELFVATSGWNAPDQPDDAPSLQDFTSARHCAILSIRGSFTDITSLLDWMKPARPNTCRLRKHIQAPGMSYCSRCGFTERSDRSTPVACPASPSTYLGVGTPETNIEAGTPNSRTAQYTEAVAVPFTCGQVGTARGDPDESEDSEEAIARGAIPQRYARRFSKIQTLSNSGLRSIGASGPTTRPLSLLSRVGAGRHSKGCPRKALTFRSIASLSRSSTKTTWLIGLQSMGSNRLSIRWQYEDRVAKHGRYPDSHRDGSPRGTPSEEWRRRQSRQAVSCDPQICLR